MRDYSFTVAMRKMRYWLRCADMGDNTIEQKHKDMTRAAQWATIALALQSETKP